MAMSKGISSGQVSKITECVICTEPFKEPKVLPCIHTFCLHCLEEYGEDNDPGDKVKCPLCRKEFKIPRGGFKRLSNNYFIIQLMQLGQSLGNESRETCIVCDLCSRIGDKPPATVYCIECGQHLCQLCCARHSKWKAFMGHQAVSLKDKPSSEQLKKMVPSYCEKHPSIAVELYCYDCKMIACYACYVESHNAHKSCDVKKAGEELRGTIVKDIEKIVPCISKNRDERKEINEKKKSLIDRVATAKRGIGKKYDELKLLLDSHRDQLHAKLDLFKAEKLKEIETIEEEVERQFVILESFKRYCEEMKDKGSSCDISRNANDLHVRALELVKMQEDVASTRLSSVDIMFRPALTSTDKSNLFGKLSLKVEDNIDNNPLRVVKGKMSNYKSTSFLTHSAVFQVVPCRDIVYGVAVVGKEVFVASHRAAHLDVYHTNNFTQPFRLLKINDKTLLYPKLAACSKYNCLYVGDYVKDKQRVIYRVECSNSSVTEWMVNENCIQLSVTRNGNILMTLYGEPRLQEYKPDGSLIREISLDSSIRNPMHCVQLCDGNFVVSHRGAKQHRVCIVDANGYILKSYGGSQGSGVDQLHGPYHLSVDSSGYVFVADCFNYSVLLLSPTLTLLGTVQTPPQRRLKRTTALHLDENSRGLYIGDVSGCVTVFRSGIFLHPPNGVP